MKSTREMDTSNIISKIWSDFRSGSGERATRTRKGAAMQKRREDLRLSITASSDFLLFSSLFLLLLLLF
ncbi:hypothetical protein Sjap_024378 [Stephania japonica]|uniref:Uncharacterized protein n=1 Tax=Stephania japonica TaxID=461633 RepID=A0AAP0HNX0_9MAGN